MPREFFKRDVALVQSQLATAISSAETINKIEPTSELNIALAGMHNARVWLKELAERTPESNNG